MTEPLQDERPEASARPDDAGPDSHRVDADAPGPNLPPPSATESLVSSLLEAGPEVAEHVVRAAQELLLAAQVIVDAAERAVQEQQAVRAQASADAAPAGGPDGGLSDAERADGPAATVHHLDLGE